MSLSPEGRTHCLPCPELTNLWTNPGGQGQGSPGGETPSRWFWSRLTRIVSTAPYPNPHTVPGPPAIQQHWIPKPSQLGPASSSCLRAQGRLPVAPELTPGPRPLQLYSHLTSTSHLALASLSLGSITVQRGGVGGVWTPGWKAIGPTVRCPCPQAVAVLEPGV